MQNPLSLGLAGSRQKAGVTLEQIAETTKISKRFLSAIEAGDYGVLPGGVFTTSYIRQYAEATGSDAEEILEHYQQWLSPEPESGDAAAGREVSQVLPKWATRLFSLG
jgi:cytoskeletal protein RodZ